MHASLTLSVALWSACGKRPCAVGRYGQQSIVNDFRTGEKKWVAGGDGEGEGGGEGRSVASGVLTPKGLIAARTTKQCTRRFFGRVRGDTNVCT